tara:strand:+ start:513 stop:1250 length:738 start_codon:yes stop_codon:yes gene_type:complete
MNMRPNKIPSVPVEAALWISSVKNRKTGDVPTLAIGRTREESKASCKGCTLLESGDCYAQYGTSAMGHASMEKAHARGKDYSLKAALLGAKRSAKMARFGMIGDPAALGIDYIKKAVGIVNSFEMAAVGYTHHWKKAPEFAGILMASCDNISEVDTAMDMGYRATVVLPWDHEGNFTTPEGRKGIVCPAISKGRTCNTCLLCDGSKKGPIIGFPNHSNKARAKLAKAKKQKTISAKRLALESVDI